MKNFTVCIVNLILLVRFVAAQPVQSIDNSVREGLNDVYNLKFNEAESKFKQLQISHPDDLSGFFYASILHFFKALPARNEKYFERYMELSEEVIDKAELTLEKNEKDYDALYFLGLSKSYRSLLMLSLNKSLLKAASNGNDGYKILSALVEKKPDYYDAYMGLGLYKIAIGHVPEKFQWLLSLIGFEGNIKEGLDYLRISSEKGKFTRVDSKVFLTIFSIKEIEEEDLTALNYSKELAEQFPESPLFKIFYSTLLLQNGQPEFAIEAAEEALSLNDNSFEDEIKKGAYAVKGVGYFRLGEFKKAIQDLEKSMSYVNDQDRYNVYMFTLGISYELEGNRIAAIEKYRKVRNNFIDERDGEMDKFFYRLAQQKINEPLTELDRKLIEGLNLRESGKPEKASEIYQTILGSSLLKSDDDKIRFYYDRGLTYFFNKDFENAIEELNRCLELDPENEKWIIPHSYFELGKLYRKMGKIVISNKMFEQISDYNDFDFESFLDMRIANYINK